MFNFQPESIWPQDRVTSNMREFAQVLEKIGYSVAVSLLSFYLWLLAWFSQDFIKINLQRMNKIKLNYFNGSFLPKLKQKY